jgi:hypothetical protein
MTLRPVIVNSVHTMVSQYIADFAIIALTIFSSSGYVILYSNLIITLAMEVVIS